MEKIKPSIIKGLFYPSDKNELENLISGYKKSIYEFKTRAVIVPHAGLIYSGDLAYQGLSLLEPSVKKIFIFAPAHRLAFQGIATSSFDFFETPFGNIEIDKETREDLIKNFNLAYNDEALKEEHAIEVQLPLIQKLFSDIKVIPVLVSAQNYTLITEIIEKYYDNKEFGFIISSDLSHFLTDNEAKEIDNKTADMIESGNLEGFKFEQACGAIGIAGLVNFKNKKDFSLIRVGMKNSSKTTGDTKRVVGYGAWALYEKPVNEFLKEHCSKLIIEIAKEAVEKSNAKLEIDFPPVFETKGASFVTLNKNNRLRGCIGSIIAHRPLIEDLINNARNAAYNDPRFSPVHKEEFDELQYAISILTIPYGINFKDEQDLLNKIVPNEDGIIIRDKGRQAVYLPSVWEQLPDKIQFLNSLKVKAGLPADYFSDTFEAYRFKTTYIK